MAADWRLQLGDERLRPEIEPVTGIDPEQAFLLALPFLRAGQIQSYGLRMRRKRLKLQAEAAIDREGLARCNHIRVRQIGGELA